MVFHMLAVFDKETARAPPGIESVEASQIHRKPFQDDSEVQQSEEYCKATLEVAYSASKPTSRHLELLGHGNGFTFEASPFCSYAKRAGVHVMFAGEVSEWPGIDAVSLAHNAFVRDEPPLEENDAHWLLDFYESFLDFSALDEVAETVLRRLTQVKGSFSFVIYDEVQKRVLAARDTEGGQPLYWGATDDGHLMFGSCKTDLAACNPSTTAFPAGTMFASERVPSAYNPGEQGWVIATDDLPGRLFSFLPGVDAHHWRAIKAIPRLTSQGVVCGAVYKVASVSDLTPEVSTF